MFQQKLRIWTDLDGFKGDVKNHDYFEILVFGGTDGTFIILFYYINIRTDNININISIICVFVLFHNHIYCWNTWNTWNISIKNLIK